MASGAAAKSGSNEPATFRLVIRAEIIPEQASQATVRPHSHRRTLALVAVGLTVLLALSWIGISVFSTDSTPTPAPLSARSEAVSAVSAKPQQQPATSTTEATSAAAASTQANATEAKPVEPEVSTKPAAPSSPINEVIPDVPRSALQTIRGTIRVSVQVTVDKQGAVIAATSDKPGPSRYFERLALEASKKWTFAPMNTDEQRRTLVRFNFTGEGTTARADPL